MRNSDKLSETRIPTNLEMLDFCIRLVMITENLKVCFKTQELGG
jgi:hypothetical protein